MFVFLMSEVKTSVSGLLILIVSHMYHLRILALGRSVVHSYTYEHEFDMKVQKVEHFHHKCEGAIIPPVRNSDYISVYIQGALQHDCDRLYYSDILVQQSSLLRVIG